MSLISAFKQRLPKKRWKRVLLYAGSTFCIALAIDMSLTAYWRRIGVSRDTTFITSPLLAEGTPDYPTWLNDRAAQGVTPENNALVPLVKAFGLSPSESPQYADWEMRTLRAMGLPEVHILARMLSYGEWARQQADGGKAPSSTGQVSEAMAEARAKEEVAMRSASWSAAEHPLWAQWIESQSSVLALAHEAAVRGRYYMPAFPRETPNHPGQVFTTLLPTLGPTKYTGYLLMADAMMHAHDADKGIFLRDMTDALKLGALLNDQGIYLITRLVGVAMMQEVESAIVGVLADGTLQGDAARNMLAALDALPADPPLDLTGERCGMLDLFAASAFYGLGHSSMASNDPKAAPLISLMVPVRFEAQMRMVNAAYDKLDEEWRLPSYRERVAAVRATQQDMFSQYNKALLIFSGYLEATTWVSEDPIWMPHTCEVLQRAATQRDLTCVALAVAVYHADKSAYPDALDALAAGGILKEIPRDGFTDLPLIYRKAGDGYILYSAGPDLKDDGGNADKDVVVRMER